MEIRKEIIETGILESLKDNSILNETFNKEDFEELNRVLLCLDSVKLGKILDTIFSSPTINEAALIHGIGMGIVHYVLMVGQTKEAGF